MRIRKILFAAAIMLSAVASAQGPGMNEIPFDPNVRKGTLPNGLTYYIRHNEWPEDRADFYIAQKVGSILEDQNQLGLAHFLEHMCFNGTKNFPGDKLKVYLESIGVKFGENLNASTGFDETIYNVNNVPVNTPGAIDSCLLILHDWSHDLLLEEKEIDKERGVINEEWRMRRSAMMRMYEAIIPEVYAGSKYAQGMPIGTMDVVMNFKYDALRDYYHKWYRPDLQGVIIVGDVNVDSVEQKIKTLFADIKMPENPAERIYYPVPDNKEPIVTIAKDKEQQNTMIYMFNKHEIYPDSLKSNPAYYMLEYAKSAMANMFASRFAELTQQENPPFLGASVYDGTFLFSKTKGALNCITVCKDNNYTDALKAMYREVLRAARYGFTVTEMERFKQDYKSMLDNAYAQKDKVENNKYVQECVSNFTDNEPMPGIEWEYENMKQLADMLPVQMINEMVKSLVTDSNFVVAVFCPEKEGIVCPTKDEILSIIESVKAEKIEPYKEEVSNEPLVSNLPAPGKVKKIADGAFGTKVLTLSNGIKIHIKQTDYKPNTISMEARSWGGTSLYPDNDYINSGNADMISIGGWGNFSAIDLQKKLAGITASSNPFIRDEFEGISGGCTTKDFETLLQLVYLNFTAPRKDQSAYNSTISRVKASLQNQDLDPRTALQDTIAKVVYNNDVRSLRVKAEDVDKMNYDRMLQIYKERFADADDFEFFFVGDINIDSVKPLFEKYLAVLPTIKGSEKYNKTSHVMSKGVLKNVFEKEQETPSALIQFVYHAPMKDNMQNSVKLDMLKQIMQMVFTQTVREDEGGAYSVGVTAGIRNFPEEIGTFGIILPTAPAKREAMTEVVYNNVADMVNNGPKEEDLQKVKEYMLRSYAENVKNNDYWMNILISSVRYNIDNYTGYEDFVKSVTCADIQKMAKTVFDSGNRIEVGMTSPADK